VTQEKARIARRLAALATGRPVPICSAGPAGRRTGDKALKARRKSGSTRTEAAVVGIIMGSQSDWETMRHAAELLERLGVAHETRIVSAHRTPKRLYEYAESAKARGLKLIIAGAGGAAHLPGMTAALTPLPVLGVPVESKALSGLDSLLSIVQMPAGIPVGTFAIGKAGAVNAALLAAAVLALENPQVAEALEAYRVAQTAAVEAEPATA
jgi:5-(carboxyamino)imidazole ribonucleotide mutase